MRLQSSAEALERRGYFSGGTLSGNIFNDINGDGIHNANEGGLANWTIYQDVNHNSQFDAGDVSAKTDAAGNYSFTNIAPTNNFTVLPVIPAGWLSTGNSSSSVSFSANEVYKLPDGFSATQKSFIVGDVQSDTNGDGVSDSDSHGLSGQVVYIDQNNNGKRDSGEEYTTTNSAAMYKLGGLSAGHYMVRIDPNKDETTSGVSQGIAVDVESLSIGSARFAVTVPSNSAVSVRPIITDGGEDYSTNRNFLGEGQTITLGASIGYGTGTVEWDTHYNAAAGFKAESTGSRLLLTADPSRDSSLPILVATRLRAADGTLGPIGVFKLDVVNTPPTATLVVSGGVVGKPVTATLSKATDPSAADIAAGFKYSFDFNGDGDYTDPGEVLNGSSPTAAFTYAAAGSYSVHGRITDKDGGSTEYKTIVTITAAPVTDPATLTIEAETAALTGGTAKATNHAAYTGAGFADFGGSGSAAQFSVARVAAGSATLAFRYANGDTKARPLSVIVNGVTIGLIACAPTGSWDKWGTVSIDASLLAGTNTIKLVAGATTGGNLDSLTITTKSSTPTPPVTPPVIPPASTGSLSGFAFNDNDKDGVLDTGEVKTNGKTVFLDTNNNGKLDAGETSVVTDANGGFSFTGLAAGTYHVRRVFPTGYTYSTKLIDLTLTAGQIVSGLAIGSKTV